MSDKKRVLVTGMAGQIGGIIRQRLGDMYELSGIDRVDVEGVPVTVADIADLEAIKPAFDGVDVVAHLGADPSPARIVGFGSAQQHHRDAQCV